MICSRLELCMQETLAERALSRCDNRICNCIESSDRRSEIKCEENRKKYVLENTKGSQVVSYRVDGGVIVEDASVPAGIGKCDYMLALGGREPAVILIELKGMKVSRALEQIQGVLALYQKAFKKVSHVYGRAVVTSSVPDLKASPRYVNLTKMLRGIYHGNLKIAERECREKDVDLSREGK